jgi:hypothetical protein
MADTREEHTYLETLIDGRNVRARVVPYPLSLEPGESYGNSNGNQETVDGPYGCGKCERYLYVVIDQGTGEEFAQHAVLCGQANWDLINYCYDLGNSVCSDCAPTCNHKYDKPDDKPDENAIVDEEEMPGEHIREVALNDADDVSRFGTVWGYRGYQGKGDIRVVDCNSTCKGECLTDFFATVWMERSELTGCQICRKKREYTLHTYRLL